MTPEERLYAAAIILRDAAEALQRNSRPQLARHRLRSCRMSTTHPPSRPPGRMRTPRRSDKTRTLEGRILARLNDALASTGAPAPFIARVLNVSIEDAAARLEGSQPIMVGELIQIAVALELDPSMFFAE